MTVSINYDQPLVCDQTRLAVGSLSCGALSGALMGHVVKLMGGKSSAATGAIGATLTLANIILIGLVAAGIFGTAALDLVILPVIALGATASALSIHYSGRGDFWPALAINLVALSIMCVWLAVGKQLCLTYDIMVLGYSVGTLCV